MEFESNDELKKHVKDGVLDCKGESLICPFNISIEASIINAVDITAVDITAWDINARNINAGDINARNINARDINAGDINARDIIAGDINAGDIIAGDINAGDINVRDIDYYAVCFAYENIKCKSIKGSRENCKHFCLDGKIIIKEDEDDKDYLIKDGKKYEVKVIREVEE